MLRLIKRFVKFVGVTWLVVGGLAIAVIGLGLAEQPLFAELYIPGNTIADHYDATVPVAWFHLAQQVARETPGFTPPVISRAFGYMGITLYEALVPGMPGYQSLAGQLKDLRYYEVSKPGELRHWPTVANTALAEIIRKLFPNSSEENRKAVDALEEQFNAAFKSEIREDVLTQSQAHGKLVANHIFEWSLDDGGHEAFLHKATDEEQPAAGVGLWAPTPPRFEKALLPNWHNNRPFVLSTSSQCAPPAPPRYSTDRAAEMYYEANEIYAIVKKLTPEDRQTAQFWSDDPTTGTTTPGHVIGIATEVLQEEDASLSMAAIVYSQVGLALEDSMIGAWETKYTYKRMRPITYIQQEIDAKWMPPSGTNLAMTPPSPSYTAEAATQLGAAMTVLSALFGDEYEFDDLTNLERGLPPRSYASFMAAAEEAAVAQLYAGIHYRSDTEDGLKQGVCIGDKVKRLQYIR